MSDDGIFDAAVAATYDQRHDTDPAELAAMVGVLADLAGRDGDAGTGAGMALEFAIGTGRVALPLQAAGVTVKGIEISRAMVEKLRQKPGGAAMEIAIGDMTTTRVAGAFPLVFLVYNTIDNLLTQAAQVACFRNAAAHLAPGGRFLVETLVPPLLRLSPGETRLAFARSPDHWGIDEFDVVSQRYTSHHIWPGEAGAGTTGPGTTAAGPTGAGPTAIPFRYAFPAEMDLMAQIAGLKPDDRWGNWQRGAFTAESTSHISVWRKPLT